MAMHSDFFQKMFYGDFAEAKLDKIVLSEPAPLKHEDFALFLSHVYDPYKEL